MSSIDEIAFELMAAGWPLREYAAKLADWYAGGPRPVSIDSTRGDEKPMKPEVNKTADRPFNILHLQTLLADYAAQENVQATIELRSDEPATLALLYPNSGTISGIRFESIAQLRDFIASDQITRRYIMRLRDLHQKTRDLKANEATIVNSLRANAEQIADLEKRIAEGSKINTETDV